MMNRIKTFMEKTFATRRFSNGTEMTYQNFKTWTSLVSKYTRAENKMSWYRDRAAGESIFSVCFPEYVTVVSVSKHIPGFGYVCWIGKAETEIINEFEIFGAKPDMISKTIDHIGKVYWFKNKPDQSNEEYTNLIRNFQISGVAEVAGRDKALRVLKELRTGKAA